MTPLFLIKAEDIDHLKISSAQSLYTNAQGYAVIPNVSRYERNRVTVDPASFKGKQRCGTHFNNSDPNERRDCFSRFLKLARVQEY